MAVPGHVFDDTAAEQEAFSELGVIKAAVNDFLNFMDFVQHGIAVDEEGLGSFTGVAFVQQISLQDFHQICAVFLVVQHQSHQLIVTEMHQVTAA